jgi:(2R)-3-sulfolactate dehydrogenase (NADP+)
VHRADRDARVVDHDERVEVLVAEMMSDDGVRLPGARREALRARALEEGIVVADALLAAWRAG